MDGQIVVDPTGKNPAGHIYAKIPMYGAIIKRKRLSKALNSIYKGNSFISKEDLKTYETG